MNMDESEGFAIEYEDPLTSYGGCNDDHLPMYGGPMTERELALIRELDPDFDKTDHGPVIDVDAELAALGYKTGLEVLALKVFDPKPSKLIPVGIYCDELHWKAPDLYWLPKDVKSGIKDKVQTFIKRSREEVGDSIEAFVQYLADYSSTTTAAGTKDEVKGGSLLKRPRKDLDDSTETLIEDPSLLAADSSRSGTKAKVNEGFVLMRACEDLGL